MARVLVVDDAAFVRKLLAEMLTRGGHEVVGEAGTGEAAVELHRALRPDVAIIDVNMPGGDGYAATDAILADDPDARVVLASVYLDPERLAAARRSGVTSFLAKPFELDELLGTVGRICGAAA